MLFIFLFVALICFKALVEALAVEATKVEEDTLVEVAEATAAEVRAASFDLHISCLD